MGREDGTAEVRKIGGPDGKQGLSVYTFPELREAWKKWATRHAWRRRKAGHRVEQGELQGYTHITNKLVLWFLSLTDEDQQRILEEGDPMFRRLFTLEEEHDQPVIEQRRTASVFAPAAEIGPADAEPGPIIAQPRRETIFAPPKGGGPRPGRQTRKSG